jgi:hypothetical protein
MYLCSQQRQSEQQARPSTTSTTAAAGAVDQDDVLLDSQSMQRAMTDAQRNSALLSSGDTYRKLKEDLLRSRRAVNVLTGADAAKVSLCAYGTFLMYQ